MKLGKILTSRTKKSRRLFLKSSAATGLTTGFQIVKPELVRGTGQERLKAGIVGCGGRGTRAVNDLLSGNSNIELVSMGDLFEDQLEKSIRRLRGADEFPNIQDRIKVTPDRRHTGFEAYKKVINSDDYALKKKILSKRKINSRPRKIKRPDSIRNRKYR